MKYEHTVSNSALLSCRRISRGTVWASGMEKVSSPPSSPFTEQLLTSPLSDGRTDLLVCAALGVDLADCVYPTRTAVRLPSPSASPFLAPSSR